MDRACSRGSATLALFILAAGMMAYNEALAQKIVFVSNRDGNPEVYVMNGDGSGQTRLTNSPEWEYAPRWSPDGTCILYQAVHPM